MHSQNFLVGQLSEKISKTTYKLVILIILGAGHTNSVGGKSRLGQRSKRLKGLRSKNRLFKALRTYPPRTCMCKKSCRFYEGKFIVYVESAFYDKFLVDFHSMFPFSYGLRQTPFRPRKTLPQHGFY